MLFYGVEPDRILSLDQELLNRTFVADGSVKVLRSDIAEAPVRLFALPYRLNYDPQPILDNSEMHKIYANGMVTAYY